MVATFFACGPDPEHVCDSDGLWVTLYTECRKCGGTGTCSPHGGVLNCKRCKATGMREAGGSVSCSVCRMSAFDRSFWEGP